MTRDEETYFLRLMQVADEETLLSHFTHKETLEQKDGSVEVCYDAHYQRDEGYFKMKFMPDTKELLMAEMNVGFPTMIGLNRSPLELRILAEHFLDVFFGGHYTGPTEH